MRERDGDGLSNSNGRVARGHDGEEGQHHGRVATRLVNDTSKWGSDNDEQWNGGSG